MEDKEKEIGHKLHQAAGLLDQGNGPNQTALQSVGQIM